MLCGPKLPSKVVSTRLVQRLPVRITLLVLWPRQELKIKKTNPRRQKNQSRFLNPSQKTQKSRSYSQLLLLFLLTPLQKLATRLV